MAKIEQIRGWLKSVDTDRKTLTIRFPMEGIQVVGWGNSPRPGPKKEYGYNLSIDDELLKRALDEDVEDFAQFFGQQIECILKDNVVVDINPI